MSVRLFSDSHLYRTGSLKWTGITTAKGEPTIGAWVAEMDFGTAPEVADAMKGAIDDGLLGYQQLEDSTRVYIYAESDHLVTGNKFG